MNREYIANNRHFNGMGTVEPYYIQDRRQDFLDNENSSSGLGAAPQNQHRMNEGSMDMRMMVRGSLISSDEGFNLKNNSDDLTLDMLGGPTTEANKQIYNEEHPYQYIPQITSKKPPSSALNLLADLDRAESREKLPQLSLEQYRQNNSNLQHLLMQFDSTPQFNQIMPNSRSNAESAPYNMKVPPKLAAPSSGESLHEVSSFTYMQKARQQNPDDQIDKIRENLNKIELLQQAIHNQAPNQGK